MNQLQILAIAPLPFRIGGRRRFQFGGSIFFEQLLPQLAGAGHRVRVLAEAPPPAQDEDRAGLHWDEPNLSVEWFALEYRSGATPPPATFVRGQRSTLEGLMHGALEEHRPDVVLLGRESLVWYVPEVCRRAGLPIALVAGGSPSAGLAAGIYPSGAVQAFADRLRSVDLVISMARHLAGTLRRLGVGRVRTIPNVVDPGRFQPRSRNASLRAELALDPEAPVVGYFAGLAPCKRPLDVVASAASVLEVEPRATYLVSGSGARLELVQRAAAERGIAAAFRWLGEVEHASMPDLLNLVDVVVHASEREGSPHTYLEAQACGSALVASDIPASRELIVEGQTGMLFPAGHADELAARTLELLRDPEARADLGRSARAVVAGNRLDRWASAYARALAELVASSAPSAVS